MELTKKYFVQPHSGSLTPADIRLRPLLGVLRTSGAVPSGLFSHPPLLSSRPSEARGEIYLTNRQASSAATQRIEGSRLHHDICLLAYRRVFL